MCTFTYFLLLGFPGVCGSSSTVLDSAANIKYALLACGRHTVSAAAVLWPFQKVLL
jgi:hypothetical protein